MERNILLTIEYDGTNFCGWQRQPGLRTVQGQLEQALTKVCGKEITLNGTSRTDAGVHALGQRASFRGEFGIPTDRIMLAVNNLLCGGMNVRGKCADVCIRDVREMPADFHARFDSKGKKYRYIIRNSGEMDVFARNYCYQVKSPLNLAAMQEAAALIVGTHDFACFQAAGGNPRGNHSENGVQPGCFSQRSRGYRNRNHWRRLPLQHGENHRGNPGRSGTGQKKAPGDFLHHYEQGETKGGTHGSARRIISSRNLLWRVI